MHTPSLLIGSTEFLNAIRPAILEARERVLIQVMTFEMDSVGRLFWDLLRRSAAQEKILCVDAFSTAKISDELVFGKRYLASADFRREARETRRLLGGAERHGIRIVVTNPLGFLWWRYPFRNHKKMMIVDNDAFLGGINLSEHNFAWADLMLKSDCPSFVEALVADFYRTIGGSNSSHCENTAIGDLYLLDGRNSRAEYEGIFGRVTSATASIDIISPYLSNPLLRRIKGIPASVRVRVVNPAQNNKGIVQQALFRAAGSGMELLLQQPGMSHVKAILIDDRELIIGSSNFDFVSYDLQQEVALCTSQAALIDQFRKRVLEPVLDCSVPAQSASARFYHRGGVLMALSQWYVSLLGLTRRWTG